MVIPHHLKKPHMLLFKGRLQKLLNCQHLEHTGAKRPCPTNPAQVSHSHMSKHTLEDHSNVYFRKRNKYCSLYLEHFNWFVFVLFFKVTFYNILILPYM